MLRGVKVGMVKCEFFWLRILLRLSTPPTTNLVLIGKAQVLRDKVGTAIRQKSSRFLLHTRIHLGSHLVSHWVHKLYGGSNLL